MRIAVFFVGDVDDNGFNANALAGAERADDEGVAQVLVVDGVPYDEAVIRTRLADVMGASDGLVFVGGQGNVATPDVAAAFPDKRFAIVQGERTGPNLASYDVLQEQSAFLAGVAAAMHTRTGIVGHLSGHRVRPGLKGRAAFVGGVAHVDPDIAILTAFCGTQDDNAVAASWAAAEIDAGADILFTMLNGARHGAIDACRAGGARQIGNALDWVALEPDVFLASAIARIDLGVERAIADMARGETPTEIVELGLAEGDYARLSMASSIPDAIVERVERTTERIRAGDIVVPSDYDGDEFTHPAAPCVTA